ncbi:MAG: PadR family transcriptional regulator [Woeseiaceae bacterium]|nr:PadR family transcriptional regulator [Woeseiaceae bacterium]
MDVKTVCLGMLTDGEASGYDMKKCFESSFGHFFPAGYGSIYPALSTLARNGLVEYELVPQEGKPDRKVYSITKKGREALMEGLSDPNPSHKVRSEFLATLWFAHLLSGEQLNTVFDNKLDELDEFLKLIDEFETCECPRLGPGAQFVAGFGKHMANALKQYIEENRHLLAEASPTAAKRAVG